MTQDDLISWLALEFEQSNDSKDDNWQNFKSLCEAQKPKDSAKTPTGTNEENNVKVPASRVCYLDKGSVYTGKSEQKYEKRDLALWSLDNQGYNGFNTSSWSWSNLKLWEYFKHHHPKESPLDKFNEWYKIQ